MCDKPRIEKGVPIPLRCGYLYFDKEDDAWYVANTFRPIHLMV